MADECPFAAAASGPFFAASTIAMIRHGRKELTHDVLTGFATLLNVPANDLFALAGIDRSHAIGAADPDAAEFAKLICDLRPLSAGQVRQVREWAHSSEPG